MADYGNGLISSIVTSGDMGSVVERGVTAEFFPEERDQRVFRTMLNHYKQYGTAPTEDVVLKSFPTYEIGEYPHPLEYYIDALAQRRRQAIVINAAQEVVEALNTEGDDPGQDAVRVMEKAILQAQFETSPARHVSYVDAMKRRIPEWMNGLSTPSIPYGIPTLDQHTGGMRPEQFIVLTGLAKARKTWVALHIASNVQPYAPVVFITFEMSHDEQLERLGTLWGKVPYEVMRNHDMITEEHFKSMIRFLHVREQFHTFLGVEDVHGHSTVTALQALIQDVQPGAIVIDGVYFMTDEVTGLQGSSETQALTNISRALKKLATKTKVTVVATTQTLYSKTARGGKTSLFGMGYTSAFSQDADVVLGVERLEDQPTLAVMRILGNRSGLQGIEFHLDVDLDTGVVEEVGLDDEGIETDYDDIDEFD